jgi:hypothetical protein
MSYFIAKLVKTASRIFRYIIVDMRLRLCESRGL